MNVVFISPHFPTHFVHFVSALRERGVNVLGIGDAPYDNLSHELRSALTEYFFTPSLNDQDALLRATGYFTWRHGRIDRIDSLNETWLAVEAQLRQDFHVPGLQPADIDNLRSKLGQHDLFKRAGIPHPSGIPVKDAAGVKAFAASVGYPLVIKPSVGVGAAHTFKVSTDAEVDAALAQPLVGYMAQAYVRGAIVTYDGLVDREGRIVFVLSHEYSDGGMETVLEKRDIAFWSRKEIPAALDTLGRKAVAALGLRERWFHLEFFRLSDGSYMILEANLRPPGGFITDMMNYTCDIDVYQLWARLLSGEDVSGFQFTPKYHVCHSARRAGTAYRNTHEALVAKLGKSLLVHRELPAVFHSLMGNEMYLTRHDSFSDMQEAVRLIQGKA
jgi:hypothetical protein